MANRASAGARRWIVGQAVASAASVALAAVTGVTSLGTASASSDIGVKMKTPYTFVDALVQWENLDPGKHVVTCTVVSNQGVLNDSGAGTPPIGYGTPTLYSADPKSISGTGSQLFSDRHAGAQPFDLAQADVLGLRLGVDPSGPSAIVTLTFQSWGGATATLTNLAVVDDVLIGTGPSVGNSVDTALFTLSCSTWAL